MLERAKSRGPPTGFFLPPMPRSLFRKEAIDAQRQKFLGEASIAQPVQGWVYTVVAVGIAATVVAIAVWGQYTRRERVQGFLSNAVGAAVVKMPERFMAYL